MTEHRYLLTRQWVPDLFITSAARTLCWVMLNPSTADDHLIIRCTCEPTSG